MLSRTRPAAVDVELLDVLPDAVVVIEPDGTVAWANRTAERMMGRPRATWIGTDGFALVHPDDLRMAALSLGTVHDKECGSPIELRVATQDGWRLVELIGVALDDGRVVLSMRDLTQRRRWEVAGDDVARFRSLVHNAASLTMLVSRDGHITAASGALTRQLGHDPEDVCGAPLADLVDADDRVVIEATVGSIAGAALSGHEPVTIEVSLLSRRGDAVPYELTIVSLLDDPTVEGLVVSGHDITRLRAAQDALAELAHYDPLTGIPNRRTFEHDLHREWTLTSRDGIDSYVVVADLDRFKRLNDRHGHAAGDEALRQFGRALRLAVRETDVVARLGGDEFAVLLVRCGGEAAAIGFENRLRELLRERLFGFSADVGVSLGHASMRAASSPADALHRADLAMLANKRSDHAGHVPHTGHGGYAER